MHQRVFAQAVQAHDRPIVLGLRDPRCREWDWRRALTDSHAEGVFWLCHDESARVGDAVVSPSMLASPPVAFDGTPSRQPQKSPLPRKNSGTRWSGVDDVDHSPSEDSDEEKKEER